MTCPLKIQLTYSAYLIIRSNHGHGQEGFASAVQPDSVKQNPLKYGKCIGNRDTTTISVF